MRAKLASLSAALSLFPAIAPVSAASLQVTPVSLDVPAPGAATTLTLTNPGKFPLKAQLRVYRWSLVNGEEHLEPAAEVVASPPLAALKPDTNYTVRVIRLSKQPIAAEETYRLVVDEIPDPSAGAKNSVNMAFRYSIPVFFTPNGAQSEDLQWSLQRRNGKTFVSATNTGSRRVRISDLVIGNGSGKSAVIAKGLAGYVLARSSKSWVAPGAFQTAAAPLLITAQGDRGPINARALPDDTR